jgi:large subunit ribosomal protein L4
VVGINKKVKTLARKSALTYKAKANAILVVEDFSLETIKTKEIATTLKNLGIAGKKTLFLTAGKNDVLYKSGRNIPTLNILEANKASTYDILDNRVLLLQKSAVKILEENLL